LIYLNKLYILNYFKEIYGDWGLGIGDWGLGGWGQNPNPKPPNPNPQTPKLI